MITKPSTVHRYLESEVDIADFAISERSGAVVSGISKLFPRTSDDESGPPRIAQRTAMSAILSKKPYD